MRRLAGALGFSLASSLLPGSVAAADCRGAGFVEVAAASGLDFVHDRGAGGDKHLPETMGAGVAWLDLDGDGWQDLYAVQSGPFPPAGERSPDGLFRNQEGRSFADWSARTGSGRRHYGQGVAAADADGDGDTDLYLANFGPDVLLLNDGLGALAAAPPESGLALDGWSSSAAWADADGDGDLDLYVARYVVYDPAAPLRCTEPDGDTARYCDPTLFVGEDDRFYENRGGGRFVQVSTGAGLPAGDGRGLGVVFTDLDGDRRPEVYVANDLDPNLLLANRGGGRFADVSLLSGSALSREGRAQAGMGIAVADFDGDADPDLVVTNFDVEINAQYRNDGALAFEEVAAASGFGLPSFNKLGFGVVTQDFDRDGALDVFVANGHIFEHPRRENVSFAQPAQLLAGDGRGGFAEVDCPTLAALPLVARGAAAGDFDNDGDPDVAVHVNGGPLRLWRNEVAANAWLGVALRGANANTEAVGAVLDLASGGRRQRRWVTAGDSYQSTSDRRMLFGAPAAEPLASLTVTWPDGARRRLLTPPRDRYLVVPAGVPAGTGS